MDAAINDGSFGNAGVTAQSGDDARLIEAARAGDRHAFESLYLQHVGRVYAICLRLTGHVQTAEELTQESFVRAGTRKLEVVCIKL